MKEEVHVPGTPTPRLAPSRVRRVSWGAIFSGMFVTIVIQVMLTLLGVAVGLTAFPPGQHGTSTQAMGRASGIWLLVSGLISIWIGSCVAGRLSGGPRRTDGLLHGIVTWSVSTAAMFLLLATTVGSILGGVGSFLSSAMSGGGRGAVARTPFRRWPARSNNWCLRRGLCCLRRDGQKVSNNRQAP